MNPPPPQSVIYSQALALLKTPQAEQGYQMLKQLADQGFEPAQLRLGEMFARGQFVPRRADLAKQYLNPLLNQQSLPATLLLSWLAMEELDKKECQRILNHYKPPYHPKLLHLMGLLMISRAPEVALDYFAQGVAQLDLDSSFAYLACGQEFGLQLDNKRAQIAWQKVQASHYPLLQELKVDSWQTIDKTERELQPINLELASQIGPSQVLNHAPIVVLTPNCVTLAERAHLIRLASPSMQRAEVIRTVGHNQGQASNVRTNSSMFLSVKEKDVVAADIEQRVAQACHQPHENGEPFNCLNYQVGQEYQYHFDYFAEELASSQSYLKFGGQRVVTGILFLNHVAQGGETELPKLKIKQSPVPGAVLSFHNVDELGQPDERSLHAGLPVIAGEKWVATRWFRANKRENH
ncbi:hypothetical protein FLL45_12040 [Aliikangiella marina]|uniref:Fe2OG dioxygenase domain-containing protein n=1 Tax=Aliikangiella marina TaxID=1712262 RepID=A0A545T8Q1_9GAMM|nr:2OG-Fe(II) oxygenase [Aliikangiella marina]TQV73597.1 hypothetical protein FLL45_12040 [Aliikangiella marina]